jgi:hypothetical protein
MSTNFQLGFPWVPSLQDKVTHVPNPSVGSIQMKLKEINQKRAIDELEVSSPNKTLKNLPLTTPSAGVVAKAKLDFLVTSEEKGTNNQGQ